MFDPEGGSNRAGRQNPRKPSNDDPIILNVETDGGDGPQPSSNVPPKRPSDPRITSKPNRPRKPSNGSKIFIGVVLALAIVIGLFFALAQFVTDVMWYSQLGFQSVIWTQLGTRVGLWLAYAVLIAAVGFISATLAIWARPDAADGSTIRVNGDTIEIGKSVSSKSARRIAVVISLIVGLVFGSQFNANWSEILLMFNSQSFGTKDPQFGIDNGFYVFVLPGLKLIMSAVSLLLLAGIIFSIVTHVLMGGIRITIPVNGHGLFHITKRARRQIGIWLMLNMFAWAANQVLGVLSHGERHPPRHVHHGRHHRHPWRDTGPVDYEIPYVGRFRTHRGTCFRSAQGVEGADRGHRLRHRGEPGAYRGLAGAAAALPRQSERAGNGIHLYPAQHRRHPRRVRFGQGEGRTVQGHHRRRGRRIGRFRGIHRSDPPARPADHLPDVQTAAAVQAVLPYTRTAMVWWPPTATR